MKLTPDIYLMVNGIWNFSIGQVEQVRHSTTYGIIHGLSDGVALSC